MICLAKPWKPNTAFLFLFFIVFEKDQEHAAFFVV